jgi:tetratricopeptide (TPR) repeat protein
VNDENLTAADAAYAAGDYETAAAAYRAAADERDSGTGPLLHLAGNALMKLRLCDEAIEAYRGATADADYDRRGAVYVNMGSALSTCDRHEEALDAYDAALADEGYATPYKALQGKAAALYALGRYDDAATTYRQAAWADGNTDPGKALNNLGLCFMAVGKPQEAVEAFKAALGMDTYASKGKASVNLALAYGAMGFFDEAVVAFETARDTYGHLLSGDTLQAYEDAKAAADGPEHAEAESEVPTEEEIAAEQSAEEAAAEILPETESEPETVEGWETGEMPSTVAPALPDTEDEQTARFFNMTEDEMREADKVARREKRAEKRTPRSIALRIALIALAVIVVAGGVFGVLYAGFGFPTQEQTVSGLIDAYRSGDPYTQFWVAVPTADVKEQMRALPAKFESYDIAGIERAATRSTVVVVIKLDSGTTLSYDVKLAREGVGWKVIGVDNRWNSTGN